jgi:hypothetical protein
LKKAGLLKPATDPGVLVQRAWLPLDGVTDDWIKGVKFARVPGGGRPSRLLEPVEFAALFEKKRDCTCCCKCCIDH